MRLSMVDRPLLFFSGAILIGRIAGLVRELVLGHLYGPTRVADLIVTFLSVPDTLANFLMLSGFNAALVPFLLAQPENQRPQLISGIFYTVGIFFLIISIVLASFSEMFFGLLIPGLQPFSPTETAVMPIIFVTLMLTCCSGIIVAWLAHRDMFFAGGIGTLVINVTVIIGLFVGYWTGHALVVVVLSVLLAGFFRTLIQWVIGKKYGFKLVPTSPFVSPSLYRSIVVSAMAMTGLALLPIIFRAFISLQAEGAVTLFALSVKVVEVPLTAVFWGLGLISLPRLATLYLQDHAKASQLAQETLFRALFLGVGCYILMAVFAPPLVESLFGNGRFSDGELQLMAQMAVWGSSGLPAMGATSALVNDFFARGKHSTVLTVVLLNILLFGLLAAWLATLFDYGTLMLCWVGTYFSIAVALWLLRAWSSLPKLRLGWSSMGCIVVFIGFVLVEQINSLKTSLFYASVSLATAGLAFYIGLRNRSSQ